MWPGQFLMSNMIGFHAIWFVGVTFLERLARESIENGGKCNGWRFKCIVSIMNAKNFFEIKM